jgi:hypothetical protein
LDEVSFGGVCDKMSDSPLLGTGEESSFSLLFHQHAGAIFALSPPSVVATEHLSDLSL